MKDLNADDKENNKQHQIIDESNDRRYFSQIPNYVDDLGLSPYAFRLYVHIKRVTGESGKCWQSTKTLAKSCNMGIGSVTRAKKELAKAKLIEIEPTTNPHGGKDYHVTRIVDIWLENSLKYSSSTKEELDNAEYSKTSTTNEQTSTKGVLKNNSIKNNQDAEKGEKKGEAVVRDDEVIYMSSSSASQTPPPSYSLEEEDFLRLVATPIFSWFF